MNVKIDGMNIFYEESGKGQDVLLLHGWGSSTTAFKGIMSSLGSHCRFVALDFPGCGKSDIMERPWDIDDYANFILKFIKETDLNNPILVGHSNGGRVCIKLAGEGLLSPPKMILIDSAGLIPKKSLKQRMRAFSFIFIKRVLTLPFIKNHSEKLLDSARDHFGSADYKSAPPVLRQTLVKLVNKDLRDILQNILCPTLLIWGENDTATPLADARIMEKKIPDAGLCIIKNTGHFSFCERPFEANAIIKSFLG